MSSNYDTSPAPAAQAPRLSAALDWLIRIGGGEIARTRTGGVGEHMALIGCAALPWALPVEIVPHLAADEVSVVDVYFPAAIVSNAPLPGSRLVAIGTNEQARRYLSAEMYDALLVAAAARRAELAA